MDQLQRQIARARRRLVMEQFVRNAAWTLFACLLVAVVGLMIPKFRHVDVAANVWNAAWLGGSLTAGLVFASIWTFATRRSPLEAAIEIDRRYQLRERVSSVLTLPESERHSEVGEALTRDAIRRVERIDVAEHFRVQTNWVTALPAVPVIVAIVLLLLPNVDPKKSTAAANPVKQVEVKKVQSKTKELEKSLRKTGDKLAEKGLKEAEDLLRDLEKAARELSKKDDIDRKKAMIKINDMAKKLEDRRAKMGGAEKLKEKLEKLSDVQSGPADKLAKAMKQGDFKTAMEELDKLKEKIENGEMSQEDKEKLAEQMEQVKEKINQMKQAHEQAKEALEEQIRQKKAAGDNQAVNDLQNKLDQLNQMNEQMDQMDKLAEKMGQCAKCLNEGNSSQASQQLSEMMQGMQDLQEQLDELETLDEALDQLMASKDGMSDSLNDSLAGMGGKGQGNQGNVPGDGNGEGSGFGNRDEQRGDTNAYDSKVPSQIQKGQAVIAGKVDGPNVAGAAYEDVKESIVRSGKTNSDPLTEQKLSRDQRDHAREYFRRYQPDN